MYHSIVYRIMCIHGSNKLHTQDEKAVRLGIVMQRDIVPFQNGINRQLEDVHHRVTERAEDLTSQRRRQMPRL